MNVGGGWEKEEEVEKYGLERDSRGEEVKVDSVTNSGLQCTDFFVLPDDDAARSFGTCDSNSDPDPFVTVVVAVVVVEWPFGTWDSGTVSGFGGCSIFGFGVRIVKQNFGGQEEGKGTRET